MSSFLTETPFKPNVTNLNQNTADDAYAKEMNQSRKIEFDRGNPLSYDFPSNRVSTIPYTLSGFVRFMWEQIHSSPFNIFLIFLFFLYLWCYICAPSNIHHLELYHSIVFHLLILIVEILISLYNFAKTYLNDREINNQKARIFDLEEKRFVTKQWGDIKVGHIIRVNKNEVVPADIILLEAMEHNHQCYWDYSSINGNFDSFVVKRACNDTHAPSMKTIRFNDYVKNIKGVLKYEEPNPNLHTFNGRLKLESFPRASDITEENFVMRGSSIKNINYVYGLVVYSGMETKIMQTWKLSNGKRSSNPHPYSEGSSMSSNSNNNHNSSTNIGILKPDRDILKVSLLIIQYLLLALYVVFLFILILIELHKSFLCYYSFISPTGDDHPYLEFYSKDKNVSITYDNNNKHSPFFEMYITSFQYAFSLHMILPFNWFGLIGLAYAILSKFIQWDTKVLKLPKNKVEIINKNCIADFGQVRHILTDKTGTLTSRKFILKACSIHGKLYSFDHLEQNDENYIFRITKNDMTNLEIYQELYNSNSQFSANIKEFIEYLCLCHSAKVSIKNDDKWKEEDNKENWINKVNTGQLKVNPWINSNDIIYGSCYAEEKAMLKMFSNLGYKVVKTKNNYISLEINKERKVHCIIGHNKYSEDRRRMSIIIRNSTENNLSTLLCKGNDFSIFDLIKQDNQKLQNEINKTKMQIKELSKYGYRFFIFCKRTLSEEDTVNFVTKYKSAENYVLKSEEHWINLAIEYEKNMELLGVLFFTEKVSNDVKYSITKLNNANIKVWIASGDKRENVISVGKSLNIYNSNTIKGDFSDKDKPEDLDIKMSMLLMQFWFPNEKINKMKTRKGVNVEQSIKCSSKDLTILISGGCFTRICADQRNFQSWATLLSYCTNLLAYSFTPNDKYVLCQMIKQYVSKNTKVLAIGDGFNDFMMWKEADLSIGIRSREILQVKNTCDIIVNKFSQIVDWILVHGTWNFSRWSNISMLSFYANFTIVFPIFLHQNANTIGSAFYMDEPLKLTFDILVINLFIIIAFCFDNPVERSLISLNSNVYKQNFYDSKTIIIEFVLEFIIAAADSVIIYYLHFVQHYNHPVNQVGESIDQEIFGHSWLYTTYTIIFLKIVVLRLHTINYIHVVSLIICVGALVGLVFISNEIKRSITEGWTMFPVVFNDLVIIAVCFLYEYTAKRLLNIISENYLDKLTKILIKFVKGNSFFKNYNAMLTGIIKETPSIISKIDKITYPEVLGRIVEDNKTLDPALESMADVSNEEVALLKIKGPFLTFIDKKIENDFINYTLMNINKGYWAYLASLLLLWASDVAWERFEKQKVTKIFKIVYTVCGGILIINPIKKKFNKYFPWYLWIIMTIEIIMIYTEKKNNDVKILIQAYFILSFPLYFSTRRLTLMLLLTLYYVVGITPAIYINDFEFKELWNDEFYLYWNLPLVYHRHVFWYGVIVLMVIYSYYNEKSSRVEFLKYQKSKAELKKDNLIIANWVPDFVREKLKGDRAPATKALKYETVSIVFCDINDFDSWVAKLSPKDLIYLLDEWYSLLDQFCVWHGLQKIETVGKTYMAAGGWKDCETDVDPVTLSSHHAVRSFEFGVDILDLIQKMVLTNGEKIKVKIGIHTGKVIPAVVGNHKPQFSWIGDTVNTTARMCTNSHENCITASEFSYEEIKHKYKNFSVKNKEIKGKGMMNLYMYNPALDKKRADKVKIPIDKTGDLVVKSVTKKCSVLVRQGSKASKRGHILQNVPNIQALPNNYKNATNTNNKVDNIQNDFSLISNKKSVMENSCLIVENSFDTWNEGNKDMMGNMLTYNNDENKRLKPQQNNQDKKTEEIEGFENELFNDSKLFFKFNTDPIKNSFLRFEKQKMNLSENLSILIHFIYLLIFLFGIYMNSQYALKEDFAISVYIILNGLLMIILAGITYQSKIIIKNYPETWKNAVMVIFLGFTIINQIQFNKIPKEFFINLTVEQILTIVAMSTNGLWNYLNLSINYAVYILVFVINIAINYNDHLIIKYNVFLIVLCVCLYVYLVVLYYNSTLAFSRNEKENKTLNTTEKMLFNLMPLHVVQNWKDDIPVADVWDNVTWLFTDIVRFTDFGSAHEPYEVVNLVSELFMRFDNSTKDCNVYKVHTIGDCYVVIGFTGKVPMNERNYYEEAKNVCKMGECMLKIIKEVRERVKFEKWDMRIGIHTGPVIAGIIGSTVVRYDIFGSDVLIANKMESAGTPGMINISEDTKKLLETGEMPYTVKYNKDVEIPSVGKNIKCYLLDNEER